MFDTSLQDSYFGSAWQGQNFSNSGASQTTGSPGSGGFIGGIISAIHNGVFDWVNLGENRRNQRANLENARKQIEYQKEYAQNGIQWRVADAKKAGIHPLYALGANTPTYTPVDMSQPPVNYNIRNPYESYQVGAMQAAQIENAELQNELLRSQINALDAETMKSFGNVPGQMDAHTETSTPVNDGFSQLGEYRVRNDLGLTKSEQKQIATERLSEPNIINDAINLYSAERRDRENGKLKPNEEYDFLEYHRTGHLQAVSKGETRWDRGSTIGDWIDHYFINPIAREYRKMRNTGKYIYFD
ncbi:MAG: DNA pilot protein [Microviridae sp.]|nr:MAG: DNA pilot protein [Microviridae sp.]AXQ66204.1 MAG: DNA pilot protein [Microviridae sp.]